MSQKLRFPFKRGMIICGYKTKKYLSIWGYHHYGIDVSTKQGYSKPLADDTIYASGKGTVVVCEKDSSLGMAIAIQYDNCESHDGKVKNLVFRYMHSDPKNCMVKLGQKVTLGTPITKEGKVGTEDYHLHVEADTDTSYPRYSPQVKGSNQGWKHGTDSSVNISDYLWVDDNYKQDKFSWKDRTYINEGDDVLSYASSETIDWKSKYETLVSKLKELIK